MAKLAIKWHTTRGKEVIEILKMLGGDNTFGHYGDNTTAVYYVDKSCENDICCSSVCTIHDCVIFTFEEFLEKYPYKVGDKVEYDYWPCVIQEMCWDNEFKEIRYTIKGIDFCKYCSVNDLKPHKEETMEEKKNDWAKWDLPDGYEFQDEEGNIIKTGVIKLVKKQPQYPKTYEECCKVLLLKPERATYSVSGLEYERHLIVNLQRLLICRDAYWKIAGEQMGLGKPWALPFNENQDSDPIYFIVNKLGKIYKDNANIIINNRILAFPTAEMRDAFYENFKYLIELCKELL